jgi:predicted esterase
VEGGVAHRRPAALACALLAALGLGCASIPSQPGVFEVTHHDLVVGNRKIDTLYVTPAKPREPATIIAYFSGDAGFLGTAGEVLGHLAEDGYYAVGYNARDALRPYKQSGEMISIDLTADNVEAALERSRLVLGLPENTPLIVAGFSRGASAVVITAAHPGLRARVSGAVAIALTRETDYLKTPRKTQRPPGLELDEKGRVLLYSALKHIGGKPLAVIQSTGDRYVPAEESRRLMGPDTPTLRLYTVEAKNHGFGGGHEELLRDLDDALAWIGTFIPPRNVPTLKEPDAAPPR